MNLWGSPPRYMDNVKFIKMENNESKVSMVTGEVESHSDPNRGKKNVFYEVDNVNDSGMETTPNLTDESVIISEAGANSTPVATKMKEKELSMNDIFNFMRAMSDDIKQLSLIHI